MRTDQNTRGHRLRPVIALVISITSAVISILALARSEWAFQRLHGRSGQLEIFLPERPWIHFPEDGLCTLAFQAIIYNTGSPTALVVTRQFVLDATLETPQSGTRDVQFKWFRLRRLVTTDDHIVRYGRDVLPDKAKKFGQQFELLTDNSVFVLAGEQTFSEILSFRTDSRIFEEISGLSTLKISLAIETIVSGKERRFSSKYYKYGLNKEIVSDAKAHMGYEQLRFVEPATAQNR